MTRMQQLENALVKAHRAGDTRGATAIAAEIKRLRAAPAPKAKPKRKVSRTEAFVYGVERGLKPIGEFAEKLNPLNYIPPFKIEKSKAVENRLAAQAAEAQRQRPGFYTGGKIAGEVIGTAPFVAAGGVGIQAVGRGFAAAPKLRKAGKVVEEFGKAVTRGGAGVRAPTTANVAARAPVAATRKGRIALRAAGGGTAGVIAGAMTDQDLVEAALAGAAVPVFGHMAKFGAGKTFDMLAGRLGEVRAAEILRTLIERNPDEITAALRSAPKNINANTAEFLASKNLMTPEIAAATRIGTKSGEYQELLDVTNRRAAEQKLMRDFIRGGKTQTEAVRNIDEMKRALQEDTGAMRTEALGLTDIGRTVIAPAEREAARARAALQRELDSAARYMDDPNYGARIGQYLDDARSAEEVAANLRAQGLAPLDISQVVSKLRAEAADAEFVSPDRSRILSEFANNLERRAAKFGGIIDAEGLNLARREMGAFVSSILGTSDPKALQQGTAQLVAAAKGPIDDAIEAAGGAGWKNYLNTFEQGMKGIERQKLQKALANPKLSEATLTRVMSGDDPDFIANILGPGRFDVNVELEGLPLEMAQKLSKEVAAQRAVAQTGLEDLSQSQRLGFAQGAVGKVASELEPTVPNIMTALTRVAGGVPGVYGGGIAAEQASVRAAERASQNVMRSLVPALASPSRAGEMLRVRPAEEYINRFLYGTRVTPQPQRGPLTRAAQQVSGMAGRQNILAQAAQQGFTQPPTQYAFPEIDPDTGERLVDITFDEYGRPSPVYGRISR